MSSTGGCRGSLSAAALSACQPCTPSIAAHTAARHFWGRTLSPCRSVQRAARLCMRPARAPVRRRAISIRGDGERRSGGERRRSGGERWRAAARGDECGAAGATSVSGTPGMSLVRRDDLRASEINSDAPNNATTEGPPGSDDGTEDGMMGQRMGGRDRATAGQNQSCRAISTTNRDDGWLPFVLSTSET